MTVLFTQPEGRNFLVSGPLSVNIGTLRVKQTSVEKTVCFMFAMTTREFAAFESFTVPSSLRLKFQLNLFSSLRAPFGNVLTERKP